MEEKHNIENKKGGKKVLTILIILVILCFVTVAILFGVYNSNLKAVTTEDNIINIEVKTGATLSGISTLLENQGVIKSATVMKIYCKLNNVSNLQAGIYELNLQGLTEINSLKFDASSIALIHENKNAYLIVDMIYEDGEA